MHIFNSCSALLLMTEVSLWTRISVQGWEIGLASIAAEWCAELFKRRWSQSRVEFPPSS
jgi:hypothetical protein